MTAVGIDRDAGLRARLLAWYESERRDLPWRRTLDPYHVLVSELMLQQTRMDVVLPYFARWTERWPTVADLARATEDEVVAMWSGLGYYRRARNLLTAARAIVAEYDGEVPGDVAALRALTGIGPYTAAAVASIAHGVPVAVVDGNVERVLCRLVADDRTPGAPRRRSVEALAQRLLGPCPRPGDWNQAVMELGALVCTPRTPACGSCPWTADCAAHASGRAADLPRRKPKAAPRDVTLRMAVVRRGAHVLLVRRHTGALLSGMWELPTTGEGGSVADLERTVADATEARVALPVDAAHAFAHSITNRRIRVFVHDAQIEPSHVGESRATVAWVSVEELGEYGASSMTRKALRRQGGTRWLE